MAEVEAVFRPGASKGFLAGDCGAKLLDRRMVGVRGEGLCLGVSPDQLHEINFRSSARKVDDGQSQIVATMGGAGISLNSL